MFRLRGDSLSKLPKWFVKRERTLILRAKSGGKDSKSENNSEDEDRFGVSRKFDDVC